MLRRLRLSSPTLIATTEFLELRRFTSLRSAGLTGSRLSVRLKGPCTGSGVGLCERKTTAKILLSSYRRCNSMKHLGELGTQSPTLIRANTCSDTDMSFCGFPASYLSFIVCARAWIGSPARLISVTPAGLPSRASSRPSSSPLPSPPSSSKSLPYAEELVLCACLAYLRHPKYPS